MSKKSEQLARQLAAAQLREVMSTPAGKALVWRLITRGAGVFGPSFSTDPAIAAFNEGKRAVGLALMAEAQKAAPGAYLEMVGERISAEQLTFEAPEVYADPDEEPSPSGDSSPG